MTDAAEPATAKTRRATFGTFAALALAGLGYVLVLGLVPAAGGWQDITGGRFGSFGPVLAIALVVLPQIAFVAGCLAFLAALRLRRTQVLPDAELRLLRRRSAIALGTGGATMVAVALLALDTSAQLAAWWTWTTLLVSSLSALPLALASIAVWRAGRHEAEPAGSAGDVFDDLAPVFRWKPVRRLELPEHPWRFALLSAVAVFTLGVAGGWLAEGDAGSGVVRGSFEAVALLVCFALLGRLLGLRRSGDGAS